MFGDGGLGGIREWLEGVCVWELRVEEEWIGKIWLMKGWWGCSIEEERWMEDKKCGED